MKFSQILVLAGVAMASPTPTINKVDKRTLEKRASITEACDIGYASSNGGTTGGAGGTTTTVTDFASFSEAAQADGPKVIVVSGDISDSGEIEPTSDTTIVGASGGASLTGIAINIRKVDNVIVRNLKIGLVPADVGDCIGIETSTHVWVDHCDLSGDLTAGKDDYDGLFDVKRGSDYITVSNTYFHDAWKASLIGHSDSNADQDTGHLTITYANNHWENINSRAPSVRFGTVHIFNNYYDTIESSAVNTRMAAQVLVESTQFVNTETAIVAEYSDDTGFANVNDVDLGDGTNTAPTGDLSSSSLPYTYTLVGSAKVASAVADAGATLTW
ncbi:pectate lyase [Geosmithia morbida]|uniref:pectate lyase n=1 Tax=Geosmithia morbida TaxID=1094350 RepID=A0A9P4YU89_9HYPO|nr:pectate lyase [Geosmithia morbida]KAF4122170.1 pectate lyase [Geosmithia morbida]